MEDMLNFARQAYLKHKVIEINYNMTQQIKDVKEEDIDKYVERYKEIVTHEFKEGVTGVKESPTGTTEQLAIENK